MSEFQDLLKSDKFGKESKHNRTIKAKVHQKKSVLLPADVHARLKLIAAQEEIFIQDVVELALEDFEKKLEKRDARQAKIDEAKWAERP